MSMTKKQMDHSWGRGIMAIALGYAMNAKPGPGKQHESDLPPSVKEIRLAVMSLGVSCLKQEILLQFDA